MCRIGDWHDLVVLAVHHQHRQTDLLQVLGEVGLRKGNNAVVMRLGTAHHSLPPPVEDRCLRHLRARAVETEKGAGGDIIVELRAVRGELRLITVEDLLGQTAGVCGGLHHQRWNRTDDRRLGGSAFAVTSEVMHDLAAAGGMADMDRVAKVQMLDHGRKIIGIMVHVMTFADLGRSPVATPVMRNDAVALAEEEQHLRVPVIG
ncbi:hypothetical protein D9M73_141180 [compost metagenome]